MALDPRISLAAQAPNLQTSIKLFDDIKTSQLNRSIAEQQMKQQAEQFPLMQQQRQQTIDANTQRLRSGEQQQQVDNENRIIRSIAEFTPTLKPLLEQALTSGDTAAAQTALTKRLTGLMNQGLPTNETVDALTALRGGNVQEVIDYLDQNEQIAKQRGLLGNAGDISVGQREYNALLEAYKKDPEGLTPEGKAAGVKLRVIPPAGSSAQERILQDPNLRAGAVDFEADKTQAVEGAKTTEAGRRKAVSIAVDFAKDANNKLSGITDTVDAYNEAIAQLDAGADTGKIYSMLPSFDTNAMILDNIASVAGFNMAKSGGGIITEADMDFGMRTAIPQNLPPKALKEFLQKKVESQQKIFKNLKAAVDFLGDGTKTIPDWYKQSKKIKGGISTPKAGGQLMVDVNGNRAIVYPDGTIEEQ